MWKAGGTCTQFITSGLDTVQFTATCYSLPFIYRVMLLFQDGIKKLEINGSSQDTFPFGQSVRVGAVTERNI